MSREAVICSYTRKQCMIAIKKIASGRKPFAQVSGLRAKKSDLEYDLAMCLRRAGQTRKVHFWIRRAPDKRWRGHYRYHFGFYREPWTLAAYDFLSRIKLPRFHRDWIQGLFYGYKIGDIQQFLDKQKAEE